MRILFWNVQRLGSGSGELKKAIIEGVLAEAFRLDVEWALLCEVTSSTSLGDASVDKQLSVVKRSKKKSAAQLGYAWIKSDLSTGTLQKLDVEGGTMLRPSGENVRVVKGGGTFAVQSKRRVAYVGQVGAPVGPRVYMYHSNASDKAAPLVASAVKTCLDDAPGGFVIVGDLNCEPLVLKSTLQVNLAAEEYGGLDVAYDTNTHNAREGLSHVYDYAVYSDDFYCEVKTLDITHVLHGHNVDKKDIPDHLPILVGISESL
jgi:hypothetical protein